MNKCKSFILPREDTDWLFAGYKNVFSSFCISCSGGVYISLRCGERLEVHRLCMPNMLVT